jgi:hypothetical protein
MGVDLSLYTKKELSQERKLTLGQDGVQHSLLTDKQRQSFLRDI